MQLVGPSVNPVADVLSVVKGLERGTLLRMSEVIADAGGIEPAARRARPEVFASASRPRLPPRLWEA